MSDDNSTNGAAPVPGAPKPKRIMSAAQREALAKGQAALRARREERKAGIVQTSSAEIREAQQARAAASRTMEDVVARHADEAAAAALPSVPDAELPPPVEQVARATKLYTVGSDPLPPPETNPHLNDGIIASSDAAPDLVGIQPPKNLADLMAMCPTMGDGQYYIEVVRRAPQHYGGVVCKGSQRPIREFMTDADFVSFYGGGDYTLILYGPPPRGGAINPSTGRPRHKALSPPVKLEISPSIYPPNVQAAVLHDDETHQEGEDTTMRYYQPSFSSGAPQQRPPTTADARVLEVQYEHEERMQQHRERRDKELRDQQAGVTASLGPMLDVVHRNTIESVKVVERSAQETARRAEEDRARAEERANAAEARAADAARAAAMQIERERNRPTDAQSMMNGVAQLVTPLVEALKPSDSASGAATQALDQARQEIQRLTKSHAEELARLQKDHSEALHRAQEDHRGEMTRRQEQERNETERLQRQHSEELKRQEERLKENVGRAEKRAEEAERKAEQRVQEAETRAERRISDMRDEHRRQVEETRVQFQQRLDDERRQHDRDMKSQATMFDTRLAGQKDMYDNRITTMQGEVTRTSTEADRWRKEAEDNKDITKHIERAEEAAAALGFTRSGGDDGPAPPKDWKEMLGRIGMDLVQKLPDIVQSAGDTVTKLRGTPGPTPEQVQQMQYDAMMQGAQHTMARHMAGGTPLPPPMRTSTGEVFHAQPLRFGTEDSSAPLDPNAREPRGGGFDQFDAQQPLTFQPPQQQTHAPPQAYAPPAQQAYAPPPQQTYAPPHQGGPGPQAYQQPQPQQTYQPQQGAPARQAPQQQMAAPAAPTAQAPAGAVPAVIPAEMITQFAPVLEQALASGEPVPSIAQELLGLLGRGNLSNVVNGLKPERVVVELQKGGRGSSPLVRRSGQQFLRELWAACGTLLAQGG